MKRPVSITLLLLLAFSLISCSAGDNAKDVLILATTTSTENSGLLDHILPHFEEEYGIDVRVVAVGTGQALEMGRKGDADVLLVHARDAELEFVEDGYGVDRHDVMYNDFVIAGPANDPAGLKENAGSDAVKAFSIIAGKEVPFVSRGDNSGTHKKEMKLWKEAGIEPGGEWYKSVGKGMGQSLIFASEEGAYILTDRGTYLSMQDSLELAILVEGDSRLFNQYGVIKVNQEKHHRINKEGADKFVEWLLSPGVQKMIGEFGKDKFGQSLFTPNGK